MDKTQAVGLLIVGDMLRKNQEGELTVRLSLIIITQSSPRTAWLSTLNCETSSDALVPLCASRTIATGDVCRLRGYNGSLSCKMRVCRCGCFLAAWTQYLISSTVVTGYAESSYRIAVGHGSCTREVALRIPNRFDEKHE
jgi:hypothetical protein